MLFREWPEIGRCRPAPKNVHHNREPDAVRPKLVTLQEGRDRLVVKGRILAMHPMPDEFHGMRPSSATVRESDSHPQH
jgi:hypothetical protein